MPRIYVSVKPTMIEMPRVRILGDTDNTPNRQFPAGTAIQLTCQGQVGSDQSKVRIKGYWVYTCMKNVLMSQFSSFQNKSLICFISDHQMVCSKVR